MPLFKRKFKFANRKVTVNFKKQTISTGEPFEKSSFQNIKILFDRIQKLDNSWEYEYAGFYLSVGNGPIDDNLPIRFGCQQGTYAQVKAIIDYVNAGPTKYNFIYG